MADQKLTQAEMERILIDMIKSGDPVKQATAFAFLTDAAMKHAEKRAKAKTA